MRGECLSYVAGSSGRWLATIIRDNREHITVIVEAFLFAAVSSLASFGWTGRGDVGFAVLVARREHRSRGIAGSRKTKGACTFQQKMTRPLRWACSANFSGKHLLLGDLMVPCW